MQSKCLPRLLPRQASFLWVCIMEEQKKNQKKDRGFAIFCAVMIVLVLLNTFVVKLAIVDGRSMYPTLHDRQLLLVLRVGSQPRHGDVVVIHTGDGLLDRTYIVKRVIATQGDRVKIDYDTDTVTVNEIPIDEPYLNPEEPDPMEPRDGQTVVSLTVPEGTVFVMGDNRNHSADSRSEKYGPIAVEKILGKVILPQVSVS